jgi:hypothetical protein
MRTKPMLYAAVLAIVALGVLTLGAAGAAAHDEGQQSLRLDAEQIQSDYLDLGASGPSLGDQLVFSETLSRYDREVGESGGVCTVVQVVHRDDDLTFHCVATLSLDSGQITLQGLVETQGEDDSGPFTVAITGGTGEFSGASGEAVIREVSDTRSIYTLELDSRWEQQRR